MGFEERSSDKDRKTFVKSNPIALPRLHPFEGSNTPSNYRTRSRSIKPKGTAEPALTPMEGRQSHGFRPQFV